MFFEEAGEGVGGCSPSLSLTLFLSLSISLSLSLSLYLSLSLSISPSLCLSLSFGDLSVSLSLYPHTSVLLTPSLSLYLNPFQPSCSFYISYFPLFLSLFESVYLLCSHSLCSLSLSLYLSYLSTSVSPKKLPSLAPGPEKTGFSEKILSRSPVPSLSPIFIGMHRSPLEQISFYSLLF